MSGTPQPDFISNLRKKAVFSFVMAFLAAHFFKLPAFSEFPPPLIAYTFTSETQNPPEADFVSKFVRVRRTRTNVPLFLHENLRLFRSVQAVQGPMERTHGGVIAPVDLAVEFFVAGMHIHVREEGITDM